MDKSSIREYIENNYLYDHTWLRYHLYSSINYRIYLPNGVYIILNEKDDYLHTDIKKFKFQVFIEPGHNLFQINNLIVDKNRLKYIKIEDYLEKMFQSDEKIDFLKKIIGGGVTK